MGNAPSTRRGLDVFTGKTFNYPMLAEVYKTAALGAWNTLQDTKV